MRPAVSERHPKPLRVTVHDFGAHLARWHEETLDLVGGKAVYNRKALTALIDGGYFETFPDGKHRRIRSVNPYYEDEPEENDQ